MHSFHQQPHRSSTCFLVECHSPLSMLHARTAGFSCKDKQNGSLNSRSFPVSSFFLAALNLATGRVLVCALWLRLRASSFSWGLCPNCVGLCFLDAALTKLYQNLRSLSLSFAKWWYPPTLISSPMASKWVLNGTIWSMLWAIWSSQRSSWGRGKFWSIVARSMGLEARGWSRWIEEGDAVLIRHFLWKSGTFFCSSHNTQLSSSWTADGSATDW